MLKKLPDAFFGAARTSFEPVRKGGRPPKEARDAAIFLARVWRMNHCGESADQAEAWIMEAWARHGITDEAHVRSRIRTIRSRGLNQSFVFVDERTGVCGAVEAVIKEHNGHREPRVKQGARSWHWVAGMREAVEGKVSATVRRVPAPGQVPAHMSGAVLD